MGWRVRPRGVRPSAANDMATSDVHRRWRGHIECYAERCFLSGASTLAAEANQRVRIDHATTSLAIGACQTTATPILPKKQQALYVACCMITDWY